MSWALHSYKVRYIIIDFLKTNKAIHIVLSFRFWFIDIFGIEFFYRFVHLVLFSCGGTKGRAKTKNIYRVDWCLEESEETFSSASKHFSNMTDFSRSSSSSPSSTLTWRRTSLASSYKQGIETKKSFPF